MADGVADNQHLGPIAGRRQSPGRDRVKVVHCRQGFHIHHFSLVVVASGVYPGVVNAGLADGGIGRGNSIGQWHILSGGGRIGRISRQPALPGGGAEGSGHQQGIAASFPMGLEQGGQHFPHIGVGGVDFIHHQQIAGQAGGAQVGVRGLQGGQHGLIHRADGDLGGQIALGPFRRPGPFPMLTFPPDRIILQSSSRAIPVDVAGNGRHHFRAMAGRKQIFDQALDSAVDLTGGGPGGQGKIEAVHQALLIHSGKAPQSRLGFAGAGFRFDDD